MPGIRSDRNIHVSAHVTAPVKVTLELASESLCISKSRFIADAITEKLEREGFPIDYAPRQHPNLPFEETA